MGIIVGLIVFLVVFVEANLITTVTDSNNNFGNAYIIDLEYNKLLTNKSSNNHLYLYSLNNESENVLDDENNITHNEKPRSLGEKIRSSKGCYIASLSPGLIPGIYLGYGWITSDSCSYIKENIIVLHANALRAVGITGISIAINNFKNLDRKGYYTTVNLGCDYVASLAYVGFLPNVTVGGGYSFKISKNSFFRISADFGIKMFICNIQLSIVF